MNLSFLRHAPSGRRRTLAVAVALVAALPLAAAVFLLAHEGHPPLPMHGATVHEDQLLLTDGAMRALGIATEKVTLADLPRRVRATATIEVPWDHQAYATALVPGVIDEVLVRPGERVTAQQELAWLTSPELERLQLEMLVASADWALAEQLLEQQSQAAQSGAVAGKAVLQSRASRDSAAARFHLASWKLHALGLTPDDVHTVRSTAAAVPRIAIRSPVDGIVAQVQARPGQAVEASDHLFHIVDHAELWCVAHVLETDAAHVRPGQTVRITLAAVPQHVFQGTIDHIDLALDPVRRTLPVVIELHDPADILRPGMSGLADIEVAIAQQVIVCPNDALIRSGSKDIVLLRRGEGRFLRREVDLGRRTTRWTEVQSGLFPGDYVVTTGRHLLASLFDEHDAASTAAKRLDAARGAPVSPLEPRQRPEGTTSAQGSIASQATIAAQGTVEVPTAAKALVTSRIDGRIRRILVHHAQHVEAGQVLAEVESLHLYNLQLDLLQALAQWRFKHDALQRIAPIAQQAVQPQAELWKLRAEVQVLQHQIESLKRRLQWIGLAPHEIRRLEHIDLTAPDASPPLLTMLPVRAPRSGLLGEFHVVPGEAIAADDPLFEIHDISRVWVKLLVFEEDAPRIEVGSAVALSFAAHPSLHVDGTIIRRGAVGTQRQPLFPLWVELPNPDGLLRDGMMARAAIQSSAPVRQLAGSQTEPPPGVQE
jgi:RND family efflux transporter MFP subunit